MYWMRERKTALRMAHPSFIAAPFLHLAGPFLVAEEMTINSIQEHGGEEHQRRLVVFIGPMKTGSTSLQAFLNRNAMLLENGKPKNDAFEGWAYPVFFQERVGLRRITYANGTDHPYVKEIQRVLQSQPPSLNIVLALEYLILYERTNKLLGGSVFDYFAKWVGVNEPEIVIHSRGPRTSHLFSVWKQITQARISLNTPTHKASFYDYMCSEAFTKKALDPLDHFLNPIGAAHDMVHKYGYRTHVLEMAGVTQQDMEVSHAFSCSILNVKCSEDNKWVKGTKRHQKMENVRQGDPNVTSEQIMQMERIFHQRDCAYGEDLYNHPRFNHIYPHNEYWPNDCANVKAVPEYRDNNTLMVYEVRRILNCPGYERRKDRTQKVIESPQVAAILEVSANLSVHAVVYLMLAILVLFRGRHRLEDRVFRLFEEQYQVKPYIYYCNSCMG